MLLIVIPTCQHDATIHNWATPALIPEFAGADSYATSSSFTFILSLQKKKKKVHFIATWVIRKVT